MNCKKHIKLTGVSNISWKDAIVHSIQDASATLNNLTCVQVLDQRAKIQGDKITEYYVDLDLEFEIDKTMQGIENVMPENLDE
ncbi:MAG: dodecin domain-containing protein [Clostridia bacterium]|nr:dodecin domain-containing protein [Clostridia bacterium]